MKHNLKVSVSKEPKNRGIAAIRNLSFRERILRLLLGESRRVVVFIPGDRIGEITISKEVSKNE